MANHELSAKQRDLLRWLSEEDITPLGSSRGADLDALIGRGLVAIGPVHSNIPDPDFRWVTVTEAGHALLGE